MLYFHLSLSDTLSFYFVTIIPIHFKSLFSTELHRPVDRPTMNRIRSAADVTADASRGPEVARGDFTSSKGPREHLLQVHSLLKLIQNALQQYGITHPDKSVVV